MNVSDTTIDSRRSLGSDRGCPARDRLWSAREPRCRRVLGLASRIHSFARAVEIISLDFEQEDCIPVLAIAIHRVFFRFRREIMDFKVTMREATDRKAVDLGRVGNDGRSYFIGGIPRSLHILFARMSLISECLGTADLLFNSPLYHHEWRAPSRRSLQPCERRCFRNALRFISRSSLLGSPYPQRTMHLLG